jgi:hypothetical protein
MSDAECPTIRPYREGDRGGLVALFRRSFGRSISEDHWTWKLHGRSPQVENVWLATTADDKPVFHYAGIPTEFSLSDNTVHTMVAVDAMTDPLYRRRGLLTRAVTQVHSNWRDRGVAFVIGLPNDQWGSRARALGWQPLFPLQWLIRPLRLEALLARKLAIPLLNRATAVGAVWNRNLQGRLHCDGAVRVERVTNAGEEFDRLWETCKSNAKFSTVRDRAWVAWRFLSSPSNDYAVSLARREGAPVGYSAHRLIETERSTFAILAEMLFQGSNQSGRDTLLYELIESLRTTKAETLATLAVPGTEYFRWLRRSGFHARRSFSVELIPLATDLPIGLMRNADNWSLTGADFDVV